eukprot:SAG11_NODE_25151_length_363_cov_0.750000_1_plen_97_part_10
MRLEGGLEAGGCGYHDADHDVYVRRCPLPRSALLRCSLSPLRPPLLCCAVPCCAVLCCVLLSSPLSAPPSSVVLCRTVLCCVLLSSPLSAPPSSRTL